MSQLIVQPFIWVLILGRNSEIACGLDHNNTFIRMRNKEDQPHQLAFLICVDRPISLTSCRLVLFLLPFFGLAGFVNDTSCILNMKFALSF